MLSEAQEATRRLRALQSRHQVSIPERRAIVLVLNAVGLSDIEIARQAAITPRSVRRHLELARIAIATDTDGYPTREAAATWVWLHASCCTAPVLQSLSIRPL